MKYFRSRFQVALQLLETYKFPQPFHLAVKEFFKNQKKFGSQDRRAIAEICYIYFRTGRLFQTLENRKSVLMACAFLPFEDTEDWNKVALDLGMEIVLPKEFAMNKQNIWLWLEQYTAKNITDVFYPATLLMEEFSLLNNITSLGFRPKVWAKNHKDKTTLGDWPEGCFLLDKEENVSNFIQIQDLSSQTICTKIALQQGDKVWDVCSGAGGKSINLMAQGKGEFYLSDVRPNSLQNAEKRISRIGYSASFATVNLENEKAELVFNDKLIVSGFFNVVIADVPCSGSGTWFRTPEHFVNFNYSELESYTIRQKQIVQNAWKYLQPNGLFYYITCSVFKSENTEVKEFLLKNMECEIVEEVVYEGLEHDADSMYMCCFRKKSVV